MSRRRWFTIGVGSIIDIDGHATYERMRREMPPPGPRRTLADAFAMVADGFGNLTLGPSPRLRQLREEL